jgi:hypothetical protein
MGGTCVATGTCQCYSDFTVDEKLGCKRKLDVADCSHQQNCGGGGRCVGEANKVFFYHSLFHFSYNVLRVRTADWNL